MNNEHRPDPNPVNRRREEGRQKDLLAQQQAAEIRAAYREVFDTTAGSLVLGLLSAACRERQPSFLPTGPGGTYDTHAAAFRDGRKSLLLDIRDILATSPEQAAHIPTATR